MQKNTDQRVDAREIIRVSLRIGMQSKTAGVQEQRPCLATFGLPEPKLSYTRTITSWTYLFKPIFPSGLGEESFVRLENRDQYINAANHTGHP